MANQAVNAACLFYLGHDILFGMHKRDKVDNISVAMAAVGDILAVYGGYMLAVWIRFHSGLIPLHEETPDDLRFYYWGGLAGTALMVMVFRTLSLYTRPQMGTYIDKIPRLVRAVTWGIVLVMPLAFLIRIPGIPPISRTTLVVSYGTVLFLVLLERYLLFRYELHLGRHSRSPTNVLIIGTDEVAFNLGHSLQRERHLRVNILGYLRSKEGRSSAVPLKKIVGNVEDFIEQLERDQPDQLVVADSRLDNDMIVSIMIACEQRLIDFMLVPDIYRVLTSSVEVRNYDGIPVIGVNSWPLDYFRHRVLKRAEDICGALVGLMLTLPVLLVARLMIGRQSPGPLFYRQVRCGENGKEFNIYKIRTMCQDSEPDGPVFTAVDDDRTYPFGCFMRRWNLDEMPQFWNVLIGEMSLVGPRPERPHFVSQLKEDISRYMWRHRSRPGITGWAQVNGLRGKNSSLTERIRYDLYYLENWSLAFDFKILVRTLSSRENAY